MTRIKELIIKYKEVLLYLFFGVCTTIINIVVYYVMSRFGLSTAISTSIAWALSVLFAYLTNRKYVFDSKENTVSGLIKEVLYFFSCRLATGALDLLIMIVFVDILHINDMVMKIISNVIVIALNYVASKFVIFGKKSE